MIDLYYWTTPNGHKITMFLEEVGLKERILHRPSSGLAESRRAADQHQPRRTE